MLRCALGGMLLTLLGPTVWACASTPAPFTATSHDFGTVPRGALVHHRFTWRNQEKVRREITEVRVTCGCATATPVPRVVEPGQSGAIEVLVDAKKFVGPKTITIHLLMGPDRPQAYVLQVMANSRQDVVFNPGTVNFGVVSEGLEAVQTLELEYAGSLAWKVEGLINNSRHLTGSIEEKYRRSGQVGYRLTVRLKENAPGGDLKETLQLRTNDPQNPVLSVLVEGTVRPAVLVVPSPVYFGQVQAQKPTVRRITIRAEKPFRVLKVDGLDQALTSQLPTGSSAVQSLVLTWHPAEEGELTRTLVIHTDLGRHPTLEVQVQGVCVP